MSEQLQDAGASSREVEDSSQREYPQESAAGASSREVEDSSQREYPQESAVNPNEGCVYYYLYQSNCNFTFVLERLKGSEKKFSKCHKVLMSNEVRVENFENNFHATFTLDGLELRPCWWICKLSDIIRFKTYQFVAEGLDSSTVIESDICFQYEVNRLWSRQVKQKVTLRPFIRRAGSDTVLSRRTRRRGRGRQGNNEGKHLSVSYNFPYARIACFTTEGSSFADNEQGEALDDQPCTSRRR